MLMRQAAVRQPSLARKWLLVSGGVVTIAVAGTASAVAIAACAPRPGGSAPPPRVHSAPASTHAHYVPGSLITASVAERTALEFASTMGPGARVLQAQLMNVAAASKATGDRVAGYYTTDSREVWLVWIRGPWRILNCITATACPLKLNQIYYTAIDARTGVEYGAGWERAYQRG
jgi:hypothetical protein